METTNPATVGERNPTLQYVGPFALFLLILSVSSRHFLPASWGAPLWVLGMGAVCWYFWPEEISVVPVHWLTSSLVGLAVFALWIAPDFLIPGYRNHWLFVNPITGQLHSSLRSADLQNGWVLGWRTLRATLIVPVVEELFWRAWLMRWLVNVDFRRVPIGTYGHVAFWLTAILFASEHGPYWDVGLLTGIIYNYWLVRTKSVADCILMHAVTNGALSLFVIATAQWQYWQ